MDTSVRFCGVAFALAVLCSANAAAQQTRPLPHPANPAAAVPAPVYHSAFEGYRPLRDEAPVAWRGANDEVARIGGHFGMFGGAANAAPPASTTAGAPKPPAPPAQHQYQQHHKQQQHPHHGGAR